METLLATLRKSFNANTTRSYQWRQQQLLAIERLIDENKDELCEALKHDLNKAEHEAVVMEFGLIKNAIVYAMKNLNNWMQPQKVNPIAQARALYSTYVQYQPLGVVLIIGAWNYPYQLVFVPLVGALGNKQILINSDQMVSNKKMKTFLF
jgi:aldehyde dehydrogenase (NAD+)